jgi:O-antigen ligase
MAAALLLSGSRGGWAAAAVGALLIAALLGRYRWLAPAAAAVAGGVGLLALWGQNRLRNAFARGRGSADTRERLWRAAVEEIRDSPLWGAGLGDVRWMRRYIHRSRLTETELVDAHNFILDLWTKLGVLAVVSVLWLLWSFYRLAASGMGQGGVEARAVGVGLMAAMAASVAHGTVDAFYFGLPLAVLFWAFLGMAEVLATEPGLGGSSAPGR